VPFPAVPIIVGGPFATVNADRILRDCPQIDCVGRGEGEELLPEYISHRHDPGSVPGLVWRRYNGAWLCAPVALTKEKIRDCARTEKSQ
jgi:radical SAM superfamily enzyme YgiQ (UPF0313 family)